MYEIYFLNEDQIIKTDHHPLKKEELRSRLIVCQANFQASLGRSFFVAFRLLLFKQKRLRLFAPKVFNRVAK
jgi:hypothetical protein